MQKDLYGRVSFSEDELLNALYCGAIDSFDSVFVNSKDVSAQFNQSKKINVDNISSLETLQELDISIEEFDSSNQQKWQMPNNYCPNLIEELYAKVQTEEEKERINLELELFLKHNMLDLLFYLKYLVDTMRKHNIVWGVGRGSSVSSFVLFLIGVHKINPLKYNLDIDEFLK